jgi:site-specific DNA-methyltransferase (adenine-specific)
MTARYIVGDALEVLATLEPGSVDLVMSSPPFLALRSYLPADHPDKAREIGSESTPGEFLDVMLDVVEACARVLAPHGSLVFELGDTYAGNGGGVRVLGSREHRPEGTPHRSINDFDEQVVPGNGGTGWPLDKSKVLIPQLFAVALAYGFNPLTGRTTEAWRVRNTVAWCRPNPPVGRDGDKFRPATSFLTVAAKARDRYWDGDAVRVAPDERYKQNRFTPSTYGHRGVDGTQPAKQTLGEGVYANPAGAPLLDWWEIPTAPYKGAHYATYPPGLVVPLVKSMCPQKVCLVCGQPSRRITAPSEYETVRATTGRPLESLGGGHRADRPSANGATLGWSDCGHDDYRPGTVLDPFAGSGTTLAVATGHGLEAIGIDLDARNAELAYERIGMFLTVEYPEQAA